MEKNTSEIQKPMPFLKERGHTDESLTAERGKTDLSFFDLRKKAERETDAFVKGDRDQADVTRARQRSDTDSRKTADAKLTDQRIIDDRTVQTERSSVDAAILRERTQKDEALKQFLHSERAETDDNLGRERNQTDLIYTNSARQLSEEMKLHLKTQAELTTRDELMAIVSHDLRNPIGSVLSCADILLEDPEFISMGSEMKALIEMIKRSAQTSLRLINDILDMERIAEGKFDLRPTEQDLGQLVREVTETFVHLAYTNKITLRAEPATIKIRANVDSDRIAQVLSNLIGNAMKFTPGGGTVTVSVSPGENEAIVNVRDTGPGIPDDQKERIFVRYAQIANKDRRGIGLGLYISKVLIESHGGKLWVTSPPEGGSLFQFSLPN